ncbi:alpha/beta hydrolase [Capillimicrobium parvum]|uniref:AB hydrolase-1 domain-containing protein n=1 Tax=Capillimicrobium parvum TaxID=2884022 RepID=A0A9E7BZQ8_9ACTN|nr:alpha/beta hydrolase [Capillimicrobium parvum]UGS34752.1 hypothetical protein DSM104329_01134 [Capillimicrobium parvum]
MRSTLAVVLAAVAMLATAAAAHAELRFTPCTEAGQEGFECATLRVPLDRSGAVPGTVRLRVERLIQSPQPTRTLVNIEGGPGGSATWRSQQSARLFAPLRGRYQLVLVDPRGVGASRPYLRCPDAAARCARALGRRAAFYTTADSVADLESAREALGAPQLFLYGTSYGTFVASQYARTHPDRTERVVLDSPVEPAGVDPRGRATFAAIAPMLSSLCANGACDAVTRHPVADTAAAARRIGAGAIYDVLLAADENVALRAFYPSAVRSALRGDGAPLRRLAALGRQRYTKRMLNPSIWVPTNCTDMRLPWQRGQSPAQRHASMVRAINALPRDAARPLTRQALGDMAPGWSCVGWPQTSLARAVTGAPGPPTVPVLVLSGLLDLRTPPADARAMASFFPAAQLMEVPNRAHGVLRTDVACGQQALLAFVDDRPVGNPCADTKPLLEIQPVAPRRMPPARRKPVPVNQDPALLVATTDTVSDAIAIAAVAAPNGGALRVRGLRGGWMTGRRDAATGRIRLRLHRVRYLPRLRVSGWVRGAPNEPRGSLHVRWPRGSGTLRFGARATTRSSRR